MTPDELLSRATRFDAGVYPVVLGILFDEDDEHEQCPTQHINISRRTGDSWTICQERQCLNKKSGKWLYEPFPSSRTMRFLDSTQFTSVTEAFAFLDRWKAKVRKRAAKDPSVVKWKDWKAAWEAREGRAWSRPWK